MWVEASRINPRCSANRILTTSQTTSPQMHPVSQPYVSHSGGITQVITAKVRCVWRRSRGGDLSEHVAAVKLPSCDLIQSLSSLSFKASHLFLTLPNLPPLPSFSPPFCVRLPPFYCHALSTCHTFDHLTDRGIKHGG